MTIEEAREGEGRGVVYRPQPGEVEDGKIISISGPYVHVLYKGDSFPKATRPEDLEFLSHE